MSSADIVHIQEGVRHKVSETRYGDGQVITDIQPGTALTMRDGSIWFHSYNGHAPKLLTEVRH